MDPGVRLRARRLWRLFDRDAWDALCPASCAGCGRSGDVLCEPCAARLHWRVGPVCARCGEPIGFEDGPCTADHRPLRGIRIAAAPFRYAGSGGAIVRRLKFQHDPGAAGFLARSMAEVARPWARTSARRAVVVGVPLHRSKLRRRGVDQAAWLAQLIAPRLGWRYRARALARVRDTLPQGDPRVTSRAENLRGAFVVRSPRVVADRTVVLVDDVLTSGATARECAAGLRAAGARRVILLTAARA